VAADSPRSEFRLFAKSAGFGRAWEIHRVIKIGVMEKYWAIIADTVEGLDLEPGDAAPAAHAPFHHLTEFTVSCDCRISLLESYSKLPRLAVDGFFDNC
jgi:hypothetical protein